MTESFFISCCNIVGDSHVLTDPNDTAPYFKEYGGKLQGQGLCVVRPKNVEEVSAIVKLCAAHKIAIVPQGGNTGLVGGSVPYRKNAIVLSLSRMNAIRSVDPENFSMTVEAGCILETIQKTAADHHRYFPLALGAQGSCSIGGNIATNAGGILTMRYGNTRDLVLGLEVVLPNGDIWNGLTSLRKDNTGYSLKHLFIGSEGTLGIITAAVLKLYPDPGQRETFFAAIPTLNDAVSMLQDLRAHFGDHVLAFELISRQSLEYILRYNTQLNRPIETTAEWYLLVEITAQPRGAIEDVLAASFDKKRIIDAALTQNEQQRRNLWGIREIASDAAQSNEGGSIKHDIAIPIAAIPEFVQQANIIADTVIPGVIPAIFGHAGDGNLHYDLTKPHDMTVEEFRSHWHDVNHAIHDLVQTFNGSFAAEHGIGVFKATELMERKDAVELELMHAIKNAFDPDTMMNPGTIWPEIGVIDEA